MAQLKICCIKLSLATRVIAMVGLITSVLVLTQLASELTENTYGYNSNASTVSILLGLDIDEIQSMSGQNAYLQGRLEIMISFLCFALIYAVASAILVWGSIVEVSWCAIPWLVCEAISFVTQVATLSIHGFKVKTNRDRWIILLSISNMCLSIYFWIVVFLAQRSWAKEKRELRENETNSTASTNSRVEEAFDPSKNVDV